MARPKLNRLCELQGCNRPHKAKGLCANHHAYSRQKIRRAENKKIVTQYDRNIKPDEFWLFVQKELGIK